MVEGSKNQQVSLYLDGLFVGECYIGPLSNAPNALDGSDPIVGNEDGLDHPLASKLVGKFLTGGQRPVSSIGSSHYQLELAQII